MKKVIEVKNLRKYYETSSLYSLKTNYVKAVDGVSFDVYEEETLGLVGESGCGKTTTGKLILGLTNPTAGEIYLEGRNINSISKKQFRHIRKDIQIVFQNPYSALDPKLTVSDILCEPLIKHKIVSKYEYEKEVKKLLDMVGLSSSDMYRFPHEFSGGQRQRIGIARAIASRPKFIVCDEPVSALDVSVQSQILNLLINLQRELKISYLFIAHGLNVIRHMSKRVGVMYLGKIVEIGDMNDIFENPIHPYTKSLIAAAPIPNPLLIKKKRTLVGEIPSAINPPIGCNFHPRCQYVTENCKNLSPVLTKYLNKQEVACHLINQ